eukprot:TRINITY_DN4317_c0_g1_i3.p1 TRINITY_DN4317_c0_g1~~TRINITY_DN4317_c0_g1_i3.p1  ORF type:complete len:187 (+),score=37.79 TRINITY_DN4317_c0_g1_i3:412-972(+)
MVQFSREQMERWWREFTDTLEILATSRLITLAGITGHAPAGGTVLFLMTDYRIAQNGNFLLGLNETQVGLPIPSAILTVLTNTVGPRNAQWQALTGKLNSPEEALRIGLVDEVVSSEDLLTRSHQVMESLISTTCGRSVAKTKYDLRHDLKKSFQKQRESKDWIDHWFTDQTQLRLNEWVEKLKKK